MKMYRFKADVNTDSPICGECVQDTYPDWEPAPESEEEALALLMPIQGAGTCSECGRRVAAECAGL